MAGLAPGNPEHPERQSRPFDLWRTTGVIGEGACVLLLEPESSPRPGYAFVSGYAFASDPLESPGAGLYDAMRLALANAGFNSSQVDCINAWGPGHKIIDRAESQALGRLFGPALAGIPGLQTPYERPNGEHVFHQYVLTVTERARLQAQLQEAGVGSAVHYPCLISDQPYYQSLGYTSDGLPIARALTETVLSLPVHPALTEAELETIIAAVRAFAPAEYRAVPV